MKTFARAGYDNTTMNDIAKEAGYSKANLYFYFKNKEKRTEMYPSVSRENIFQRFIVIGMLNKID